jgi:hypothetical protein
MTSSSGGGGGVSSGNNVMAAEISVNGGAPFSVDDAASR